MPQNGRIGPWRCGPAHTILDRMTPHPVPVADLGARRTAGERALARAAHAPVRHVTEEFLAALNCRDLDVPLSAGPRPVLRAV